MTDDEIFALAEKVARDHFDLYFANGVSGRESAVAFAREIRRATVEEAALWLESHRTPDTLDLARDLRAALDATSKDGNEPS